MTSVERKELWEVRYRKAQLAFRFVEMTAVVVVAVLLVLILLDVRKVQDDNAQRQQCIVDLAYGLAERTGPERPPLPLACQELPPPPDESRP